MLPAHSSIDEVLAMLAFFCRWGQEDCTVVHYITESRPLKNVARENANKLEKRKRACVTSRISGVILIRLYCLKIGQM